jgi:hypothetical protein
VHKFILSIFISLYMFRATMCPSSGETTVFLRHLVLVILCGWLSGMQGRMKHSALHTRQSSTGNNKYQVSQKHSCFSWWWTHSPPKHVETVKYTKNKFVHKVGFITRLYSYAQSTEHKTSQWCLLGLVNYILIYLICFFLEHYFVAREQTFIF